MIREQVDVSVVVRRDGQTVVLRLNRDTYRLNRREALRMADQLVDAVENGEKP